MPVVSGFTVTLADRVRETTSTTGTGTYELNGAVSGFRTFVSGIGSGNRTLYTASLGSSWEIGIGTVTSGAPATLSRDQILVSSNSGNAVSWGAGTKDIFCDLAATLSNQIWAKPSAFPACFIEQRGPTTPTASPSLDFGSIAGTARIIHVGWSSIRFPSSTGLMMQLGDSGGIETSGYASAGGIITETSIAAAGAVTDKWTLSGGAGGSGQNDHYGSATMMLTQASNFWTYHSSSFSASASVQGATYGGGAKSLSAALTTIRLLSNSGVNFNAIGHVTLQIIHAVT